MTNYQRLAAYKVALAALKNLLMFPIKDLPEALNNQIKSYEDSIHEMEKKQIELEETLMGR